MTCEADYIEAINEPTVAWYEGASTAVATEWVCAAPSIHALTRTRRTLYTHVLHTHSRTHTLCSLHKNGKNKFLQ